jgi:hypothetical protein
MGSFALAQRNCCKMISGAVLSWTLFSGVSFGQQEPDACRDVLQKTDISRLDTMDKKLAYLRLIESEADWQHARSASGGLQAVFDGIPISATGSYGDFQKWQQSELNETNFDLMDQEVHSLQTSFTPSDAIDSWKDCMRIKAGGLALAVDDVSEHVAKVHLYWVQPTSVPGTSAIPVKIEPASSSGGSLAVPWPHSLGHVDTSVDEQVSYNRNPGRDLMVAVGVSDDKGHHTVSTVRIPADPKYIKSCSMNLLSGFHGVAHGETWEFPPCKGLKPGDTVTVQLKNASFKVDGPHAIWIELADGIDSDSIVQDDSTLLLIGVQPGDPIKGDDTPKPWAFSHVIKVPWDGIVRVRVYVLRAQIFPGPVNSLSAVGGTLEIN